MSSEYEKKNEPTPGQKDDKSAPGRQGQNPQGGQTGREGNEPESAREGQGGSQGQRKPSTGRPGEGEPEAE